MQSTMKLFVHPSILNIFIHFSESNAHMMPVFLYVNKYTHTQKKKKKREKKRDI